MARHLFGDRFACANSSSVVVRSNYFATNECQSALLQFPGRRFRPHPIDLKNLEAESICDKIGINIDFILVDGVSHISAKVTLSQHRTTGTAPHLEHHFRETPIGSILQSGDRYYCNRFPHIKYYDPFKVALLMIHPDLLYGVADEIIAERNAMPDYF
jgi:hypothetical protein